MGSYLWYYIFPLFVFFIAAFYREKKWSGILIILLMLFFSMFRGDMVGTDTLSYMERTHMTATVFPTINAALDLGRYELLYYAVCVFIDTHNLSPRLLIWFFSIITLLFIYLGCRRFKVNLALFLSIYVFLSIYLLSFNIARQCMAVSICFYGVSYLIETGKKKYYFFLWILIAALFHTSSVFTILLYPFSLLKIKRNLFGTIVYLISIVGCLFSMTDLVFGNLQSLGLVHYAESYGYGGSYKIQDSSIVGKLYNLFMLSFYYYAYITSSKRNKTDIQDNLLLFAMIGTGLFASETSLAIFRLKIYFTIFLCLFLARFFNAVGKDSIKTIIWFILSSLWYFFLARASSGHAPYYMQFTL